MTTEAAGESVRRSIRRLHQEAVDAAALKGGDVELLGLGVIVTVMERLSNSERRRALLYLLERYGRQYGITVLNQGTLEGKQ